MERERATADQQKELVAAEIRKKAAEFTKEQLRLLGEGEKLKLLEIAKGQEAQALVLGKDAALQLAALEKALAAAIENDRIVKVPTVQVTGTEAGSFEGARLQSWARPISSRRCRESGSRRTPLPSSDKQPPNLASLQTRG